MSGGAASWAPTLVPVGRLTVEVSPPVDLGPGPEGRRRMIAITGGTLVGELGTGVVMPGGADWQTVHDDGTLSIDASYVVVLDDGTPITVRSAGVRAQHDEGVYFRAGVTFTAHHDRPDLNGHLFVSSGVRQGNSVLLDLFRVT